MSTAIPSSTRSTRCCRRRSAASAPTPAAKPLNPEHGEHKDKTVVEIDEQVCIGCTLCIQACPVDAILGAPKQMHTIIKGECTGCNLCIPPCPVECIHIVPVATTLRNWSWPLPPEAGTEAARHG
jgi:electron transport complex protein RnfB